MKYDDLLFPIAALLGPAEGESYPNNDEDGEDDSIVLACIRRGWPGSAYDKVTGRWYVPMFAPPDVQARLGG